MSYYFYWLLLYLFNRTSFYLIYNFIILYFSTVYAFVSSTIIWKISSVMNKKKVKILHLIILNLYNDFRFHMELYLVQFIWYALLFIITIFIFIYIGFILDIDIRFYSAIWLIVTDIWNISSPERYSSDKIIRLHNRCTNESFELLLEKIYIVYFFEE